MAVSAMPIRGVTIDSTTYYNNASGANDSSDKLYIIGAKAQDNAEETYSNSNVYEQAGTLTATGLSVTTINGVTVGNDPKFTDTTYTPSDTNPVMDGTAAAGSSATYARGDHVHPSDTSRVPTTRTVNNKALSSDITLSASDVSAIPLSAKGAASGVAELDANGFVPAAQLPSYVDDIIEAATRTDFPTPGETGKIYVALDTNLTYRWSGNDYVEVSPSLALGETSSTAYRGDRGKVAYDHATETKVSTASAQGAYKIAVTAEGHIGSVATLEKADIGLGNVNNTSDVNKPISTAQQAALDLKAPLNSPAFTGTPTVPDLTSTSSTTQIANKQYVDDAIDASGFAILSYGHSTWQEFIDVYTTNRIVYCRASSQSNPATGSQTRLAFMAYVNNADNPTNVEFQYYRSVSSHSATQQGDQVYVYKLDKTAGWTVTVREAYSKVVAGTGLDRSYASGTITLTADVTGVKGDDESAYRTGNINITKANIGLDNVDNTADIDKPISTAQQTALDDKVDKVTGKGLSTEDYTSAEKTKLSGIATGAEVNQNAFSNVTVGSTTIAAESKTDTLTLEAGTNITLTPDATTDKVTIAATDTNTTYTFANGTNGFTVTPSGGSAQTVTVTPSITIDTAMSDSSTNAVQNKVIKKYVDDEIYNAIGAAIAASY